MPVMNPFLAFSTTVKMIEALFNDVTTTYFSTCEPKYFLTEYSLLQTCFEGRNGVGWVVFLH